MAENHNGNGNGNGKMQLYMMLAVIASGAMGTASLASSQTSDVENTSSDERQDAEIRRMLEELNELEQMFKEAIASQDTVVQREMRLLDDTMLEKISALKEMLEIRLESSLGDDLDVLTNEARIRVLEADNAAQRVEIQNLKERIMKIE